MQEEVYTKEVENNGQNSQLVRWYAEINRYGVWVS